MAQAGASKTAATNVNLSHASRKDPQPAAAVQLLGANQSKRKNTEGTQGYAVHKIMNARMAVAVGSIPAGRGFGGKSLVFKPKPNKCANAIGQGPAIFLSKS